MEEGRVGREGNARVGIVRTESFRGRSEANRSRRRIRVAYRNKTMYYNYFSTVTESTSIILYVCAPRKKLREIFSSTSNQPIGNDKTI